MSRSKLKGLCVVLALFATSVELQAQGLVVTSEGERATFSGEVSRVESNLCEFLEIPQNAFSLTAFTTTDNDILLVDAALTVTAGSFFNVDPDFGIPGVISDTSPPRKPILGDFFCVFADSWVTTPGATAFAGANTLDAEGTLVTHFDTTLNPPLTDFQFAEILLVPDETGSLDFTFDGTIQTFTDGDVLPSFNEFSYTFAAVPEPGSFALVMFASCFIFLNLRRRKRN